MSNVIGIGVSTYGDDTESASLKHDIARWIGSGIFGVEQERYLPDDPKENEQVKALKRRLEPKAARGFKSRFSQ
jgi:hypothetical protein